MSFAGVIETSLEYFLGTDNQWDFTIYTDATKTACRNVAGYTTSFMVKRKVGDADVDALITATGTVSGVFNATPSSNTQIISVAVVDSDTDTEIAPGLARWELKRTDAGFERVLAFGTMTLRRAVHVA